MKGTKAITGIFTYVDDAIAAIRKARSLGHAVKVYTPTYVAEIDHEMSHERSKVAVLTLVGGLIGLVSGFALAIMCGMDWPLRVSAKDIVAPPAYIVIGYECMILFGALATLTAIFHFCRLPDIFRKVGYDPRFSDDKFGVVVGCNPEHVEEVKHSLINAGAEEVQVHEGL